MAHFLVDEHTELAKEQIEEIRSINSKSLDNIFVPVFENIENTVEEESDIEKRNPLMFKHLVES